MESAYCESDPVSTVVLSNAVGGRAAWFPTGQRGLMGNSAESNLLEDIIEAISRTISG